MTNRFGSIHCLVYAFLFQSLTVLLFAWTAHLSLSLMVIDIGLFGFGLGLTIAMPTTIFPLPAWNHYFSCGVV